jgi:ribosomal protein L21E
MGSHKIVTDNGPTFTSGEFREFMQGNGILHVTSAPYHPATNGLAERGVQTLKQGVKKTQGGSLQERLSKFLFKYRLTPHSTTGVAPSEMLMGRKLRSRLDLLFPDMSEKVRKQQEKQKENRDNSRPLREFKDGDAVYVENFSASQPLPKWLAGTVVEIIGSRSYLVELRDGRGTVRRHIDSIRARAPQGNPADTPESESDISGPDIPATATAPITPPVPATDGAAVAGEPADVPDHPDVPGPGGSTPPSPEHSDHESDSVTIIPPARHSARSRPNPDWFGDFYFY